MDSLQQPPQEVSLPVNEPKRRFPIPTGKKELTFGFFILIAGTLMLNSLLFCGYNLGYSIFAGAGLLFAVIYLLVSGARPSFYSVLLLALDLVIIGSFARSNDNFVKFVMLCFLLISVNLGLCLMAGQNRHHTGGISSLLDLPRAIFILSTGKLPAAICGLFETSRKSGSAIKKVGSALLGVAIALPLLCILIPLLMKADAAFEAVLDNLPTMNAGEVLVTLLLGVPFAFWLYLRGVGLRHSAKPEAKEVRPLKGIGALTINTVLIAVSVVYVVYLVSQLAYFSGGFSGILPGVVSLKWHGSAPLICLPCALLWVCAQRKTTVRQLSHGCFACLSVLSLCS